MKNRLPLLLKRLSKFPLFLFFLIAFGQTLSAQSRFDYGLQFSYVFNGFLEKASPSEEYDVNLILPGPSFILGMKHAYFLNKKRTFSFGMGILYEFSGFTKVTEQRINSDGRIKTKHQYRNQHINIPLDFNYKYDKFIFSVGLVYTNVFSIRNKIDHCGQDAPALACVNYSSRTIDFQINEQVSEMDRIAFSINNQIYVENRTNLQMKWGLLYQINNQLKVGFEYRDFLFENTLHFIWFDYDVLTHTQYEYQTNALDFSIFYTLSNSGN